VTACTPEAAAPTAPTNRAPLRIGAIEMRSPVVLAPMAGITNPAFRRICRTFGGGLFVSEMVNARGLVEGGDRSWELAAFDPEEDPRSIQLYGTDPAIVGAAVRLLVGKGHVDHVDLNFGCPAPKVTRHGGGAALAARPRLFAAVVAAAVEAAGSVPVTVKMRMGLDDTRLTHVRAGRLAAGAGAAAVALHARTAEQRYSGRARWDAIGELVEAVAAVSDVPVLGNGDVWTGDDAVAMVAATGCAGVVVGRACLGRPWVFAEIDAALRGLAAPRPPALGEVVWIALDHVRGLAATTGPGRGGERRGVLQFRKHLGWYLTGYPVGSEVRRQLVASTTIAELEHRLGQLDPALAPLPGTGALPRGTQAGPHAVVVPDGWLDDDADTPPDVDADASVSGG
jgi:nifR3 family TIM-barrel protein